MSDVILEVKNLRKSFGERVVSDDVSFGVRRGEIVGLMGGSGSGKSTILKQIIGLTPPDSGEVLFEGRNLAALSERELLKIRPRIGYVFQNGALFDSLTIEENLEYPLRKHGRFSAEEMKSKINERLARIGLEGINHLLPSQLSGGMQKRAGLVRATILDPPLVLFDEPTAGLDRSNIRNLVMRIQEIRKIRELSGILVSHDSAAVLAVCNRVAFLSEGRIRYFDSSEEVARSQDPLVRSLIETNCEEESHRAKAA